MQESPPEEVTPFVFSDPTGKRWPRLRLILLIAGVLFFLATVVFVQTLFVTPKMNVPFSLRQLKGQLKALQKQNPAEQLSPSSLLWQKFAQARQAARKLAGAAPAPTARPRKKAPNNEVRLAFYANGDPYSYVSLEQHAAQITHLCPEWMTVINGLGDLQIDGDTRLPKLAASKGIALMPLLTNLVGDTWQPEAIENLAHGPTATTGPVYPTCAGGFAQRERPRASWSIGSKSIRPTRKTSPRSSTSLLTRCTTITRSFGCAFSPARNWITSISRRCPTTSIVLSRCCLTKRPTPIRPGRWRRGRGLKGGCTSCWKMPTPSNGSFAIGSYGYDWTIGAKKAELISFPEAMSRANDAEIESVEVQAPGLQPLFLFSG